MLSLKQFLTEKLITFRKRAYPKFNTVVIMGGGAGCFDENTLVKTENGYQKISEISEGTLVWTLNESTQEKELKPVNEVIEFDEHPEDILELTFENGEKVICTENHLFYVDGNWIKAKEIKVISKRKVSKRKVYDLSIKDNHNYMVSESDIIVHNSGKGFIKSNLIGLEGWSFDVDEIKRFSIMASSIRKKVKEKFGKNIADFNLKKPEDVASLHDFVSNFYSTYGLDTARQQTMFRSILMADPTRKPNLIFDVTLKSFSKLKSLTDALDQMGYDKKDIHIVWVVNDIEVALKQNEKRARTVPAEILVNTHRGVSQTMQDIVAMGKDIKKYMDGDIVFAFNKVGVDSELAKSERGGSYIKTANYFYIKRAGEAPMSVDKIKKELGAKISDYVPKNVSWV